MIELPQYLENPLVLVVLFLLFGSLTAAMTPLIKLLARKTGAIDRGGYRRVSWSEVPLLGGLGISVPVLVFYVCSGLAGSLIVRNWELIYRLNPSWLDPLMSFAFGRASFSRSFIILAAGGIAILALGLLDDLRGMRARVKLLGQFAIAIFICATGCVIESFYIPLVGQVELNPNLGVIISILWIVGLINAFNIIDGLDGLATGVALIACLTLVALGATTGNIFIVFTCAPLAGSLAAFLIFNFPPASIFLGDTGSMFIGYALATITLMGTYKVETALIIMAPMLALSFPIFETLLSMIRRFVRGVPIFAGDRHHTHHRLLEKGFTGKQVVLILYAITFLLACAGYLFLIIPDGSGWFWLPGFILVVTLVGVAWWTGYLRRAAIGRIFYRRRRNTVLAAFSRYAIQSLISRSATISPFEILHLCRRELRLSFLDARFENGDVLIGASGTSPKVHPGRAPDNPIERLRLKSISGISISVRYQFAHEPDISESQDIAACLAQIFEQAGSGSLFSKVIKKQQEIREAAKGEPTGSFVDR
ncbi:MAG: MraY family glycosyltransferase [PVC group bacterium]